jgi:hypothetical protein
MTDDMESGLLSDRRRGQEGEYAQFLGFHGARYRRAHGVRAGIHEKDSDPEREEGR